MNNAVQNNNPIGLTSYEKKIKFFIEVIIVNFEIKFWSYIIFKKSQISHSI